jgi:hypothetical protein
LSLWVPPTSLPAKNDGDPLVAKDLKDLVASLQAHLNGNVGNPNINTALDPGEKIAYAKLDLAGQIQSGDIVGILFSTFTTLKAKAQSSPNNTVAVQAGTYLSLNGLATRIYAGGNSGAFANTSGAGQNRIDVLSIDDAGVLSITAGVEAGAPVAPSYPTTKVPIAEIYIRFSGTGVVIKDADDLVNSYIKLDARSLLKFTGLADGTVTYVKMSSGAAGAFWQANGSSDLADPGTNFVTMTGMTITDVIGNGSFDAVTPILLTYEGAIELNQGTLDANFPQAEIRLMRNNNGGGFVEVKRTTIDLRKMLPSSGANPAVQTGAIVVPCAIIAPVVSFSGTTTSFKIEWRRVNGAVAGTPTIRQPGTTYPRSLSGILLSKPATF